jgi:hypothetical protein
MHYRITFATLTVNIILYMRVRPHANASSQIKPSGMEAAGFEPEGGRGVTVRHDYIIMPNKRAPKQVQHEKSWQLRPVCHQIIAKANPTPASKLAFVTCGFAMFCHYIR